ncbi:MAG: pilus assembly protein [Chloroflexi bacterium]|nr:pilus assembly protein [Chloroflexota bacterium]
MKLLSRWLRANSNGQSVVEFALTIPIILMLMFGGVQFVVISIDKLLITNAAFEAARAAAVQYDKHTDPGGSRAGDAAKAITEERLRLLPQGRGFTEGPCTLHPPQSAGDKVVVEIECKVTLLPLIRQIVMGAGGSGTVTLRSKAQLYKGPFSNEGGE